jgi:hypothetical protein
VDSAPDQQRSPSAKDDGPLVIVGAYFMLFLLGVLEGLIGCFQYSRALGSFPVAAVAFAVLIGVTCVLGAWGMQRPLGGLMPAVGWFLTSLVLAMSTPGGSVVIANTTAGKWYLFGGAAGAIAGVVVGFARWSPARTGATRRSGLWPGAPRPRARPVPGSGSRAVPGPGSPQPDARKPEP